MMTEELRQKITGLAFLCLLLLVLAPWVISLLEVETHDSLAQPKSSAKIVAERYKLPATIAQPKDQAPVSLDFHQQTKAKLLESVVSRKATFYRAQLASFVNPRNADQFCSKLKAQGFACQVQEKNSWARVYLGPMSDKALCKSLAKNIAKRQDIIIEEISA